MGISGSHYGQKYWFTKMDLCGCSVSIDFPTIFVPCFYRKEMESWTVSLCALFKQSVYEDILQLQYCWRHVYNVLILHCKNTRIHCSIINCTEAAVALSLVWAHLLYFLRKIKQRRWREKSIKSHLSIHYASANVHCSIFFSGYFYC